MSESTQVTQDIDAQFSLKFPLTDKTDLILVSIDNISFGVRKSILEEHSTVFSDMFKIPTTSKEIQTVRVEENSQVLTYILEISNGKTCDYKYLDFSIALILDLLEAADKYDLKLVYFICKLFVRHRCLEKADYDEALPCFLYFWNHSDTEGVEMTSRVIWEHFPSKQIHALVENKNLRFYNRTALLELTFGMTGRIFQVMEELEIVKSLYGSNPKGWATQRIRTLTQSSWQSFLLELTESTKDESLRQRLLITQKHYTTLP